MTQRVEVVSGQSTTCLQGWDVENRLIAITNTASGTLVTLGAHFEQLRVGAAVTNTSYYYFGGQRVAMRQTNAGTGVSTVRVAWLHGDHLGSASLTTSITGTKVAEQRRHADRQAFHRAHRGEPGRGGQLVFDGRAVLLAAAGPVPLRRQYRAAAGRSAEPQPV